jgi:hypothetical protein
MNHTIQSLYVITEAKEYYSCITLYNDKVYLTKEEAEAYLVEAQANADKYRGKVKVSTLEDYVYNYGSARYDEGAGDERESASWGDSSY